MSSDLLKVQENMYLRRQVIESVLDEDVYLFTLGSFPMMGNFIVNVPTRKKSEHSKKNNKTLWKMGKQGETGKSDNMKNF